MASILGIARLRSAFHRMRKSTDCAEHSHTSLVPSLDSRHEISVDRCDNTMHKDQCDLVCDGEAFELYCCFLAQCSRCPSLVLHSLAWRSLLQQSLLPPSYHTLLFWVGVYGLLQHGKYMVAVRLIFRQQYNFEFDVRDWGVRQIWYTCSMVNTASPKTHLEIARWSWETKYVKAVHEWLYYLY